VFVPLGGKVATGQTIAMVADPLGAAETAIVAPNDGMVIGRTNLPLVYEGDATFHIAEYGRKVGTVERHVEQFQEEHLPDAVAESPENMGDAPIT